MFLIEAGLRLVAEKSAFDHLRDELRHDEHLALRIIRKIFAQVLYHVSKHVETDEIEGAKCRGLRAPDCRSRDLVDLFNRIAIVEHRANRHERAERADAIRDKVRPILRHHHAFAEPFI